MFLTDSPPSLVENGPPLFILEQSRLLQTLPWPGIALGLGEKQQVQVCKGPPGSARDVGGPPTATTTPMLLLVPAVYQMHTQKMKYQRECWFFNIFQILEDKNRISKLSQ